MRQSFRRPRLFRRAARSVRRTAKDRTKAGSFRFRFIDTGVVFRYDTKYQVQEGFCNGRGFTLNAEEYHKCSEVNYSTTGLVLLLALPGDVRDRVLDSRDVKGFYLPPDTLVEIHPRVLHFAPCRIRDSGFNCLVVLERGTNAPLDHVDPSAPGEEGLLWMRNKWLLCHPDSPQAQKGAFMGIAGENLTLRI
ncbi:MAG: DUF4867 family protein [Clostridia bacterium]|nr:DUF4867 family protein [Clostridia bacterium]